MPKKKQIVIDDPEVCLRRIRENNRRAQEKYRKNHPDKIAEYGSKNKQRIECECGANIARGSLKSHRKTKKHLLAMADNGLIEPPESAYKYSFPVGKFKTKKELQQTINEVFSRETPPDSELTGYGFNLMKDVVENLHGVKNVSKISKKTRPVGEGMYVCTEDDPVGKFLSKNLIKMPFA